VDPQAYAIIEANRVWLRKQMNELADHLALGGAKDWAEYQHLVGKVMAFAEAERELITLQELAERESSK